MTLLTNAQTQLLFAAALFAHAGFVQTASGQTFTIDPGRSSIAISGTAAGSAVSEQGPGSLTTTYSGTIKTEITSTTIRFPAGSQIIAQNSGSWRPRADATDGSEPANYGGQATVLFSLAKVALRNMQVDAFSPNLPLSNGQFDSRSLTFSFLTNAGSTISYLVTGLVSKSGSNALSGYATNTITTSSKLETAGDVQTLTIPVDATFYLTLVSANDSTVRLIGQLVATRSVAAPLVIQTPELQNQTVTLRWQAAPGQTFQVYACQNLLDWQMVAASVTSTSNTYTWSEAVTPSSRFYRVAKP